MANLNLEITSPNGILFKGDCHLAVVPATDGEIGFMLGHETITTTLKIGQILLYDEKQNLIKTFPVMSGFAQMQSAERLLLLIE
jgi:F0F1-type ATP synthase epsilon subunit